MYCWDLRGSGQTPAERFNNRANMLYRQRTILSLIDLAGGSAKHTELTKWAFLLREETKSRGGSAFYQFLPYKYGPYSFCVFQEVAALTRNGYVNEFGTTWTLSDLGKSAAKMVKADVKSDVDRIVKAHRTKTRDALIDYVYERFPSFTVNSEIRQLEPRPIAPQAVYTAGYEGLLVDGFLNGLICTGILRLIDVRNNPVSRRYGFHKSTLARLCSKLDIEYVHKPELGIDSSQRQDLDVFGARKSLFDRYEKETLADQPKAIRSVSDLMEEKPSVLVCMEACHRQCHRSRLANAVAAATGMRIEHLEFNG